MRPVSLVVSWVVLLITTALALIVQRQRADVLALLAVLERPAVGATCARAPASLTMPDEHDGLANSMRELLAALDGLLDDLPDWFTPAEAAAMRRLRENVRAALAEWQSS